MKTESRKLKTKFEYETESRIAALKQLRKHILQYGAQERAVTAQIVRGHGFDAHVGGRHIAVLTKTTGMRLAIITSNAPDFN